MFQAILNIDYLKCLQLWEGVRAGMHNFKWYKIAESFKISRKNTIYVLRHGLIIGAKWWYRYPPHFPSVRH